MSRHALSPTCLTLVQQVEDVVGHAYEANTALPLRVGLSGGQDSLALMAALAWAIHHRQGPLNGAELTARIVDHGLQEGSADVAAQAAASAESLGVPAQIVPVTVRTRGEGIEAAAREARYTALRHGEEALIILGHTMDDQAETVLMGLARGSGIWSLAGMPAVQGDLVRPFLKVRRADTEQACRDWGLTWWDDPTNAEPMYTRSRLRAAMVQLDATLGPGLTGGLARTAMLAREGADFIDSAVSQIGIDPCREEILVDEFPTEPALRHRIELEWLRCHCGDAVTYDHVQAVDALLTDWHGQKGVSVPGGLVVREGRSLRYERLGR